MRPLRKGICGNEVELHTEFLLKKQFLPIYSGNCTVLIVHSPAQGLFSRFLREGHLEGAGGDRDAGGAVGGDGVGDRDAAVGGSKSPEPGEHAASLSSGI